MSRHTPERAPIFDPNEIPDFFIEDAERYRFANTFLKGKKVLDIACGTGYGSYLAWKTGGAESVLGVDASDEAVSLAKQLEVPGALSFAVGFADSIPVGTGEMDVAISMETIEHLDDPTGLLKELRRVLRPGGQAIISTPVNNGETRFKPTNTYHIREYSTEEFRELMADFASVEFFTQLTKYEDDLWSENLQKNRLVSSSRKGLRLITPTFVRRLVRRAVGSRGLHPVKSEIVEGVQERASVQIAIGTV